MHLPIWILGGWTKIAHFFVEQKSTPFPRTQLVIYYANLSRRCKIYRFRGTIFHSQWTQFGVYLILKRGKAKEQQKKGLYLSNQMAYHSTNNWSNTALLVIDMQVSLSPLYLQFLLPFFFTIQLQNFNFFLATILTLLLVVVLIVNYLFQLVFCTYIFQLFCRKILYYRMVWCV